MKNKKKIVSTTIITVIGLLLTFIGTLGSTPLFYTGLILIIIAGINSSAKSHFEVMDSKVKRWMKNDEYKKD